MPRGGNRGSLVATGEAMAASSPHVAAEEEVPPIPSPNIENAPPYLVQEVLKAYNADDLPVTGKGQTIAILIDTFAANTALGGFWQRNNVAATVAQIKKINVKGGHLPAREGEETLDVE